MERYLPHYIKLAKMQGHYQVRWFAAPEIIVMSVNRWKIFPCSFFCLDLKSAFHENARLAVKVIFFRLHAVTWYLNVFQVLNLVQSYVTLRVPLYVSYVFHSPAAIGGWQHFDLQSELRLTFVYDTAVLWKDGIGSPPESELQGELFQMPPFLNSILFNVLMMGDVWSITWCFLAFRISKTVTACRFPQLKHTPKGQLFGF